MITDKHFREWEHEAFGYGYGTGEGYILPALHAFFLHLEERHAYTATTLEEGLGGATAWLLINVLCRTDIVDYGTSPRYGYLSPKGELLRDYLLEKTPEELYDIVTQENDPEAPLCSTAFCNCPGAVDGQGCYNNPLLRPMSALTWERRA